MKAEDMVMVIENRKGHETNCKYTGSSSAL